MTTPEQKTDILINLYRDHVKLQSMNYVLDAIQICRLCHAFEVDDLSPEKQDVLRELLSDLDPTGKFDLGFEGVRNAV